MDKIFEHKITILETHLDTFGHVNNATYLTLCEQARWEVLNEYGLGIAYIKKTKTGPVILSAQINYKKELHAREKIKIITTFQLENEKLFNIFHKIEKPDGSLSAKATLLAAFWDTEKRKIIRLDAEWKKMLF